MNQPIPEKILLKTRFDMCTILDICSQKQTPMQPGGHRPPIHGIGAVLGFQPACLRADIGGLARLRGRTFGRASPPPG